MKNKKWIWIIVALAVVAAAAAGVYFMGQNKEPVAVYGFYDGIAGMTDYYDYSSESTGIVTSQGVQAVYLSETQTVLEVFVTEGQPVKKDDVLFTYDTTLSDIALMQKDLAVQQLKLDLQTAQKELKVINSYVPIRYYQVEAPEEETPAEPVENLSDFDLTGKTHLAYSGSGSTSLTPKYCWLHSDTMVDEALIRTLFADTDDNVLFVLFQTTEGDQASGAIIQETGLKLMRLSTEEDGVTSYIYKFSFFTPKAEASVPVDPGVEWNSGFTSSQIASMRKEKQEQIGQLEFDIKMGEAEYNIMCKEADSGQVLAEFDGVVYGVLDADSAAMMGEPLMTVSQGGGFYVEGTVSELELGNLAVGQKVDVMSWDTGMSYEGTITEIGQFPQEQNDYYYGASRNISYYPYKVFIDESAQLRDGFYVSMTLRKNEEQTGSLYVNNAFLRTEGASSYVYVRDASGLLEKRFIQVGRDLWGSYTEVRGGLTADDYLAFPYGKDVQNGAPTREGTWEDLYS